MTQTVSSRLKTPDGTILVSRHRHDFVTHTDKITGKMYGVDGGLDYGRYMGEIEDCEITIVTLDDSFDLVRSSFEWGTYGKDGDLPLHYFTLRHMANTHIEAILKTQKQIPDWVRKLFKKELRYRKLRKIVVKERTIKRAPDVE